jgi:hypothetical protein
MRTRTLDRGPREPAVPRVPHLFLLLEAARPIAGSQRHALADVDEVELGRGDARAWRRTVERGVRRLRIDVPDEWMSTVHVRIRVRVASILVSDAGSKYGTLVNGRAVAGAELADGDVIEAGRTLCCFAAGLPTPPGTAPDLASDDLRGPPGLQTLIPELARRFGELAAVAPSRAPVLVLGPTGTGKELVARAVHALSGRAGPFVAVNCGAIAPALVESELFGHRRGAFSGAASDRAGVVETSSGGTLFLDELGEIPERVQVTLLRVLQEQEVTPVGASRPVPLDLRIVAATHRDPTGLRDDLLARLRGYELELPPLARRTPDLGLVASALLRRLAGERAPRIELDVDAARALVLHRWPHNIRELERCLETALALAGDAPIGVRHLRLPAADPAAVPAGSPAEPDPADAARRAELVSLLERHLGNVSAVAEAMGKKRQQIQKWLRRYGIDPDRYRA